VTVFCDVADWSDDSCIIGVDQSSIRPEDRRNRFLRTSVNCHQNQDFTFQEMAVVIVTAVITSNYFYSINVQCKLLSQKKFLVFPSAPLVLKSIIGRFFLTYSEVRFDKVLYFKSASPISTSFAEIPRHWQPAVRRRNNGRHSQCEVQSVVLNNTDACRRLVLMQLHCVMR